MTARVTIFHQKLLLIDFYAQEARHSANIFVPIRSTQPEDAPYIFFFGGRGCTAHVYLYTR